MIWLVYACLAALALWVAAGVIDELGARRPRPRVEQPLRPHVPSFPARTGGDLSGARAALGDAAGAGRHRRLESDRTT